MNPAPRGEVELVDVIGSGDIDVVARDCRDSGEDSDDAATNKSAAATTVIPKAVPCFVSYFSNSLLMCPYLSHVDSDDGRAGREVIVLLWTLVTTVADVALSRCSDAKPCLKNRFPSPISVTRVRWHPLHRPQITRSAAAGIGSLPVDPASS